jgi:hypothetical protein
MLVFLRHAVTERFLRAEHLDSLLIDPDPAGLLARLAAAHPAAVDKWLDRSSSG